MSANQCQTVFEPLLNVKQAAELFGVHPATMLRLARRSRIPRIKIGKLWRFRISDLNTWLASERTTKAVRRL